MVDPYKKEEYAEFIKAIEEGAVEHWIDIAHALDVDPDTITKWKRLPEAQKAIEKGISKALKEMQRAGYKDWKMWDRKLQMLGVNPAQRIKHEVDDPTVKILSKFGLGDAGEASEPKE